MSSLDASLAGLDDVVHQTSLLIASRINNEGVLSQLAFLTNARFPMTHLFDSLIAKLFEVGTPIEVGEPRHPDSAHSVPFVGMVRKAFIDRVRVVDMDDNCWDIAFDEIASAGENLMGNGVMNSGIQMTSAITDVN